MKQKFSYTVYVGPGPWDSSERVYLAFCLETSDPAQALTVILQSQPFRDAISKRAGNQLQNFQGPIGQYWTEL